VASLTGFSGRIPAQSIQAKLVRFLSIAAGGAALAFLALFVFLAVQRAAYPYELEWTEGAGIDEILWITQGKPLYPAPTVSYLPLAYNPFYYILSAGAALGIGVGFTAPRLVSLLAALGCFWLLYRVVARQTGAVLPGLLAAGLYAASYRFTGAWMDLAKSDSLLLFFLLAGLYASVRLPGRWGQLASALLYVLAYFTKQLALPVLLVTASLTLLACRGRGWQRWLLTALLGLASFITLDQTSGGWFSFYTVEAISLHHWSSNPAYFPLSLLFKMWPAMLVTVPVIWLAIKTWQQGSEASGPFEEIGLAAGLIAGSATIFFKTWTYDNGFMPAAAGLSLLAGLAYGTLSNAFDGWVLRSGRVQTSLRTGALVLLLVQFGLFAYPPLRQLPSTSDRQRFAAFMDRVAGLPGEVLVFNRGFVTYPAGKNPYLNSVTFADVTGGRVPPAGTDVAARRDQVLEQFAEAVTGGEFDWVVLDKPEPGWHPYYLIVEDLFADSETYYPVTGARARPELLLVRNPVVRGGEFPLADPALATFFVGDWEPAGQVDRTITGTYARLQVALETGWSYQVQVGLSAVCDSDRSDSNSVRIDWNGLALGEARFSGCQPGIWSFDLPADLVKPEMNALGFSPIGPETSGRSEISLRSLAFIPE
jgi:hypothetical protein